jgi:hypothetical protein
MIPRGTTFEFEYLGEFKIEIKTILEHESRAHMGLIHEKNQRPKISCYCTFKVGKKTLAGNTKKPFAWHKCHVIGGKKTLTSFALAFH